LTLLAAFVRVTLEENCLQAGIGKDELDDNEGFGHGCTSTRNVNGLANMLLPTVFE
jgi:hypothetical protein